MKFFFIKNQVIFALQILIFMAHHKSALKRIRQTKVKRLRNRYYGKTTRNLIKQLRNETDKKAAEEMLPKVISNIDKLAKRNIIHKKKAGNLKSSLMTQVKNL